MPMGRPGCSNGVLIGERRISCPFRAVKPRRFWRGVQERPSRARRFDLRNQIESLVNHDAAAGHAILSSGQGRVNRGRKTSACSERGDARGGWILMSHFGANRRRSGFPG